jgi:2'-5' RNA ligase
MTERWRCFIAVPIDDALRSSLEAARAGWLERSDLRGLRWTDPARWHLTLAFLGDTERADVPGVIERARHVVRRHAPLRLPTGGLGAFRSPAAARVAWYGIADPDGRLADLARDLAEALELGTDDGYTPHLTLARARQEPVDLRAWIADAGETVPSAALEVERLEVMRSHRAHGSLAYETLDILLLEGLPT